MTDDIDKLVDLLAASRSYIEILGADRFANAYSPTVARWKIASEGLWVYGRGKQNAMAASSFPAMLEVRRVREQQRIGMQLRIRLELCSHAISSLYW